MKFNRGDDVIVDFGGVEHRGEVLEYSSGNVLAKIIKDPTYDYGEEPGGMGERLPLVAQVCVRETKVRHAEQKTA